MENSLHCKDYITEKLWYNSLYSGAVPVIFGPHKDDVAAVLPPKSYIHVEDFKSPNELVKYLYYLDKNTTAYAEYLEWRNLARFFKEGDFINLRSPEVLNEASKKELNLLKIYGKPAACSEACGFCGLCRQLNLAKPIRRKKTTYKIGKMLQNDRPECLYPDYDNYRRKLGF